MVPAEGELVAIALQMLLADRVEGAVTPCFRIGKKLSADGTPSLSSYLQYSSLGWLAALCLAHSLLPIQ